MGFKRIKKCIKVMKKNEIKNIKQQLANNNNNILNEYPKINNYYYY